MNTTVLIVVLVLLVLGLVLIARLKNMSRPTPEQLMPGQPLPEFEATDEDGQAVRSMDLRGHPTVMLFVRGNWCPFCSSQVANLTSYYKDIVDLGGRLIFVTPKPLQTTRRVAEIFDVEFDFWLDTKLEVARQFGLLLESGVPGDHRADYGDDTVWPTALVIDADGIIQFTKLSKFIADRPNPKTLVQELRSLVNTDAD